MNNWYVFNEKHYDSESMDHFNCIDCNEEWNEEPHEHQCPNCSNFKSRITGLEELMKGTPDGSE